MPLLSKILKPEDLNSTTMAEILDPDLASRPDAEWHAKVDTMQQVLDGLTSRGIIE